ncbi:MAG: exodeoxyribonuclease VII large subunit [Tidjanibacter sp.]|nr:exodeoxyribonuclease VII large subunit [Tidjanibacter sp.]
MTGEKHISLSELLSQVKHSLAEQFPLGVWICAEIGEIKTNRYSGHCYLELIEKGEKEGAPKAKASAAIWRNQWSAIESYFRSATGTSLEAGMRVLIKVSLSFHEAYGLTLVVSDIDPTYTLGESEQRKRETIAALEADGVIGLNKQLPFPAVAQRIAVVSSATAAGLQDFRRHLLESPFDIRTELFEAIVQGSGAEDSIIAALEQIAQREEEFDLVALLRGGGSQSDLECFNSYALSSHIAQFPLPVVTGIGHDKDTSVADLVAARSLKTPTAVADMLVAMAEEFMGEAESCYQRIATLAEQTLLGQSSTLTLHAAKLIGATSGHFSAASLALQRAELQLRHSSMAAIERCRHSIGLAESAVAASSPERILAMGFAVVRSGGKAVVDAATLAEGDPIEITFAKGTAEAVVKQNKER